MEQLEEVDLRQLGNIMYTKKKTTRGSSNAPENGSNVPLDGMFGSDLLPDKRERKERVVMMDGKGTGYGT